MTAMINNPSFETPGGPPGLALDWTYAVVSSLREFATFICGDTKTVVATLPATSLLGVTVTYADDGTILLVNSLGSNTVNENFAYQWSSSQLYAFVFPDSYLTRAMISLSFKTEDFEDGWLNDGGFLNAIDVIPTSEPLWIRPDAQDPTVETFENWKVGQQFKTSYTPIVLGTLKQTGTTPYFTDGSAHTGQNYSSDVRFLVFDLQVATLKASFLNLGGIIDTGVLITQPSATTYPTSDAIDTVNGTLRDVTITWQTELFTFTTYPGIADLISLTPVPIASVGNFQIIGDPGLDLDRALFT